MKDKKIKINRKEGAFLTFYESQWRDIHHSRRQDWELIKLVVLGFIGASGFKFFEPSDIQRGLLEFFAVGFLSLSLIGVFVTARHRILFKEKMKVIIQLEYIMGLNGFFKSPKKQTLVLFRKIFAIQHVLVLLYLFMANLFLYFLYPNLAKIILYYLLFPIWLSYIWFIEKIAQSIEKED